MSTALIWGLLVLAGGLFLVFAAGLILRARARRQRRRKGRPSLLWPR